MYHLLRKSLLIGLLCFHPLGKSALAANQPQMAIKSLGATNCIYNNENMQVPLEISIEKLLHFEAESVEILEYTTRDPLSKLNLTAADRDHRFDGGLPAGEGRPCDIIDESTFIGPHSKFYVNLAATTKATEREFFLCVRASGKNPDTRKETVFDWCEDPTTGEPVKFNLFVYDAPKFNSDEYIGYVLKDAIVDKKGLWIRPIQLVITAPEGKAHFDYGGIHEIDNYLTDKEWLIPYPAVVGDFDKNAIVSYAYPSMAYKFDGPISRDERPSHAAAYIIDPRKKFQDKTMAFSVEDNAGQYNTFQYLNSYSSETLFNVLVAKLYVNPSLNVDHEGVGWNCVRFNQFTQTCPTYWFPSPSIDGEPHAWCVISRDIPANSGIEQGSEYTLKSCDDDGSSFKHNLDFLLDSSYHQSKVTVYDVHGNPLVFYFFMDHNHDSSDAQMTLKFKNQPQPDLPNKAN